MIIFTKGFESQTFTPFSVSFAFFAVITPWCSLASSRTPPAAAFCILAASAICARAQTTHVVTTAEDEVFVPGLSLREAIYFQAEAGDTIVFDPSLDGATINYAGGGIGLTYDITIEASALPSGITLNGRETRTLFSVYSDTTVTVRNLKLVNGSFNPGGGIDNRGTVTVFDCEFAHHSYSEGGGLLNHGGAIATLHRCTFFGNRPSPGGVIVNRENATMDLVNCTIARNQSSRGASAIANEGIARLIHCTVANNVTGEDGISETACIHVGGTGTLTLENSIVAGNTNWNDRNRDILLDPGATLILNGRNLIGNNDSVESGFPAGAPNVNGDFAGTPADPLDPLLNPFGAYGGSARSIHPSPGSLLIDNAVVTGNSPATDQRGFARIVDGNFPADGSALPDLGAVEVGPVVVIDEVADEDDTTGPLDTSLREAVSAAAMTPGTRIFFDPAVFNDEPSDTIVFTDPIILSSQTAIIDATTLPCARVAMTTNSVSGRRFFNVGATSSLSLHGIAMMNQAEDQSGGGIFNEGGLVLDRSLLSGCLLHVGTGTGGGIFSSGTTTLSGTTLSRNVAPYYGGGIYNDGDLFVYRSTIRNNGLLGSRSRTRRGGGIFNSEKGWILMMESTIDQNRASIEGGGVHLVNDTRPRFLNSAIIRNEADHGGGVSVRAAGTYHNPNFANCTFSGNHANDGGAIWSDTDISLTHCTVAANSATGNGGGVFMDSGTATLYLAILADNGEDLYGDAELFSIRSLIEVAAGGTVAGTVITDDPLLGPLADNGGPTRTMLPLPGSPAIDTEQPLLPSCNFYLGDQRGVPRPQGTCLDLGAVEIFDPAGYVDSDTDLMDDRLEPLFGFVVGVADGHLNADHDRSSNAEELLNHTSPRDGADFLQILRIDYAAGYDSQTNRRFDITWKTFPGLSYTIECDILPDLSVAPVELGTFEATDITETHSILFASPFASEEFIRVRRN